MQSWSLIIFCYNEEQTVASVVKQCLTFLDDIGEKSGEVLVVDDGSRDESPQIIEQLGLHDPRVVPIFHKKNLGVGEALRSGYSRAQFENVVGIPADGQFDLSNLWKVRNVPPNFVISFYRQTRSQYTLPRTLLSWGNRFLNRWLLGVRLRDVNWVKIYKKKNLDRLKIQSRTSLVESEICAKLIRESCNFVEVPSACLPRKSGKAHAASLKNLFRVGQEIPFLVVTHLISRFQRSPLPQLLGRLTRYP